jgi:imidazolonepropionase-like amidohydrolase
MKKELTPERIERATFFMGLLKDEYGLEESNLSAFMQPQVEDILFLNHAGINMVLGTDTGNDFNFHGYSLHEEMQILESGGIAAMDIIKMGTLSAAKMMHVEDNLGSIEPGKYADLVLLNANPLDAIRNSLHINAVIKNGAIQTRIE